MKAPPAHSTGCTAHPIGLQSKSHHGGINFCHQANKETIPCFNCAPKPGSRVPGASCERPPLPPQLSGLRDGSRRQGLGSLRVSGLPHHQKAHLHAQTILDRLIFLLLFHFLTCYSSVINRLSFTHARG